MKSPLSRARHPKAFALVVTVSLLVLLSVIALGFLSLSAVTLRSGSQDQAMMEARANAKLALQIAIGELQKEIGPDQRITANGAIIDPNPLATGTGNDAKHPHWMGVWNSWKAGDGEDSEHSSIEGVSLIADGKDMAPTYQTGRMDYFRSWLLSLHPDEARLITSPRDLELNAVSAPNADAEAIHLVGKGSLGDAALTADYVSARLIDVKPSSSASTLRGRYAWWVGDESQKARILGDSYVTDDDLTLAEKIGRAQAPGSTGTKTVKGLERITQDTDSKLSALASHNTLDVLPGAAASVPLATGAVRPSQYNFHHTSPFTYGVIADVREGGLKRDLSALLEREIDPAEVDNYPNEFSLYKFNTKDAWAAAMNAAAPQETVPLQDLAAYYQLYDSVSPEAAAQDSLRSSNKRGVRYSPDSSLHPDGNGTNGLHMLSMDYGLGTNSPVWPSAHSSIYRQPRIVKVQFLASLFANPLNPVPPGDRLNPSNTHEVLIGITPAITFWNPTNLPVIFQMNRNPALSAQMMRLYITALQIQIVKRNQRGEIYTASGRTMHDLAGFSDGLNFYWSGIHPIRLEPGEVKTLSLPFSGDLSNLKDIHGHQGHWSRWNSSFFMKTDTWYVGHEVQQGWEPESFIYFNTSAGGTVTPNNGSAPTADSPADTRHVVDGRMRFKSADRIQVLVNSVGNGGISWMQNQSSYQDFCESPLTRNMGLTNWDRHNAGVSVGGTGVFQRGMAGGAATLTSAWRSGSTIIARATTQRGWPFMHLGMLAGVETSESSNAGFAGGRKFANRPFLHSSTLQANNTMIGTTGNALYNNGWNWTVNLLNDVYEAPVQVTATGSSYWGGGYTPESGTTHVIQQEIPVVPPISIAALSHAHLGGWSISDQLEMPYGGNFGELRHVSAGRFRHLNRAVGNGGLGPFTLQAIGNSYAHPQLRADQAYTTMNRGYADGTFPETFADHSYLANKALWDEYFFSSITPQRAEVEVFGPTADREAIQVAKDFFGFGTVDPVPLPNRRIMPYKANMDESELEQLFTDKDLFTGGLADKIAAHLMVEGPFNINSTSVEAWKVFLSSLKGKPVAYLDKAAAMAGGDPVLSTAHTGTPVGQVGLAGGAPFSGSPNDPRNANQWTSWRELTDDEIEELAYAVVKQVKLRGPVRSLSEFVNRRLEGDAGAAGERSVKGALQAALDDDTYPPTNLADADGQNGVAINAAFRATERKLSGAEISSMDPEFPLAAEGPVAYGSSAYIDQADVLRGFAEQLTPRGDTFVIRAYGDSIDTSGKVVARAWCEAVVQRLPDYVDPLDDPSDTSGDAPETKQADLTSEANETYGRKLQIIGFRWLDGSQV